ELMLGLRFERMHFGGTNRSGSDPISDADVVAAGYTVRTQSMTMDMVMFDLMYAPNDNLTFMVMPHYMWHRMTMLGIDPAGGMGGGHGGHGGGHGLPFGETHEHGTEGFGHALGSAPGRRGRTPAVVGHASAGPWVPRRPAAARRDDGT